MNACEYPDGCNNRACGYTFGPDAEHVHYCAEHKTWARKVEDMANYVRPCKNASTDATSKGEEMQEDDEMGNTELDRERWQHAACLSIAEGAPGWKEETWAESEAIRAVRKLRIRMEAAEKSLSGVS